MRDLQGASPVTEDLRIEVVTPLHIGSGEHLILDADYVEERQGSPLRVIDQPGLERLLAEQGGSEVERYLAQQEAPGLKDLATLAGGTAHAPGYDLPPYEPSHKRATSEIRAAVKDAWLRPMLPGSALKGAIRTAWIAEHLRQQGLTPRRGDLKPAPRFTASNFLAQWTSSAPSPSNKRGPNHDVFRVLRPRDAIAPTSNLTWVDIRIAKSPRDGEVGWHVTRGPAGNRQVRAWQDGTPLHAEALAPGTVLASEITWDAFLQANEPAWCAAGGNHVSAPRRLEDLGEVLHRHARHRFQREKEILHQWGFTAALNAWRALEERMERAMQEGGIPVSLGFGIGWYGMTGDWVSDETFRLALDATKWKVRQPDRFPKTRRLAVEQGHPQTPLGWVILWPAEKGPAPSTSASAQRGQADSSTDSGHPWVNAKIAELQKRHNASAEQVLRGKDLAHAWQELEDPETRQNALADIRRRWEERGWWDEPTGKAMKQARRIYGEDSREVTG